MAVAFDPLLSTAACLDALWVNPGAAATWQVRRDARLAALLTHARRQSAFHRRRLEGLADADVTPELSRIAPVHKRELMAHFEEWVTDPAITLDALREFTRDPARIGQPFLGRYVVWESSGSSGEPAVFVQDAAAMAVSDALSGARGPVAAALPSWLLPAWLLPAWPVPAWPVPVPAWPRLAYVGAVDGHFASVVSLTRARRLNPWLAHSLRLLSFLRPLPELVARLNAWQPAVLATYPSMAWVLGEEQAAGRLRIAPREIWTGGETLTPVLRAGLARRFGVPVRNSYGASECLEIAAECRAGALHLNADWVILEPVDERLRPVPPGEVGARTLLTNLANRVQPVVRYVLDDRVRLHEGRCACGSTLPTLEVEGRDDEVLRLTAAGGRPVHLSPLALETVLEDRAGVFDFELCQTGPEALRLTIFGGPGRAHAARARQALQDWLVSQGVGAVHLRVTTAAGDGLRGRSGKRLRVRRACSGG